ncbi:MAG TPA: Ig-like domain-containing protein [Methylomirabilota bacterium]|nr:Ig-like domain-containing protein [Methylomirabilota bacterium]
MFRSRLLTFVVFVSMVVALVPLSNRAAASTTPQTLPFSQDWAATGLITLNDDWSAVPGVIGYRGDDLTTVAGTDPQTILGDGAATPVNVIANQTSPNTLTNGGIAEFELADPVVAFQGSGTADAPHLVVSLDTSGMSNIGVAYDLRDVDGSPDNAVQPVALQYRVGGTGSYTNVAAGFVADASSGPSLATLVTHVSVVLPADANNKPLVQVRMITSNSVGNDEWIGVDNIAVAGATIPVETAPSVAATTPGNGTTGVAPAASIFISFDEPVNVTVPWYSITCATTGAHSAEVTGGPVSFALHPTVSFATGETCTVTVVAAQVTDQDGVDPPDNMAANYTFSFTTATDNSTTPQPLPFAQDWTNTSLITADDNWFAVPGIIGYRGDGLTAAPGTDPQTILANGSGTPIDVIANVTSPAITNGGIAEFAITDPVVGFQGSGTADAPHLVVTLDTTGRYDVTVTYDLRDIDDTADNAVQAVALQYRVGSSGSYTNVPAGFVADASSGPSLATLVTHVSAVLPADANNAPIVQVRIITADAVGSDEWVGVDNILITGSDTPQDAAPAVTATSPANGATSVAVNSNVAITFSEAVNAADDWYTITCATSGSHAAVQSGGPTTFTVDPTTDFANSETCTVTVVAALVTDQDAADPPDNMTANFGFSFATEAPAAPPTPIHDIQGASHVSPLVGTTVTTTGIVTAVRSNGFNLQDPLPDANDATSEGIFVFTSSTPTTSSGDSVRVRGNVSEFRPGGAATNLSTTEIVSPTVTVLSSGNPLPAPTVVGIGGRMPSTEVIEDDASGDVETTGVFDPASDGLDFYESLEAMLVQINNPVIVGPTNPFNEIPVLADDGAWASVRTAHGGILLRANDGNPERIIIDDTIASIPGGLNVGDHFAGPLVGVVDYNFGLFLVELTQSPTRVPGGLTKETTAAPTKNELSVATFNVENLDPGDGGAKFNTLAALIVNNMKSPDLIAVEEVQDNNGATNDAVVDANVTATTLINAILAAGGPTYEYRQINPVDDQDGGEPGGNIRQIFLFRTDRGLSFVDRPGGTPTTATTVANVGGTPQLSFSPGRIDPTNTAWNASRKPLAAEFLFNAQRLYVIANHFNSKGGDQPLTGRFQPPARSSEVQRHQQATIEAAFVHDIRAIDPNAKVVVLGDLNDFEFSETVQILEAEGLTDLYDTLPLSERYSYVFEGNSQTLDHILVTGALARRATFDVIHVNAEFADQVSDHDPSVVRILLNDAPTITAPADVSVGTGAGATTCAVVVSDAALGTATATDDAPGVVMTRTGVPAGNLFPLGTTTITYTATDAAGNTATATQRVIVTDTTPPSITAPADAEYELVSDVPAGHASDATASDNCPGTVTVTLSETNNGGAGSPASPLIITRTFTATDAAGNTATATQTITVRVSESSLCVLTRRVVTNDGVANSLCAKLDNAAAARDRGNLNAAQNMLNAYMNEVNAQRGKAISTEDADLLILLATGL